MAGSFNRVILLGNLTRDIEVRHTGNNQAVANIGLAVNRRWRSPEGENREETTFIDCEAWGKTAEIMSQYLRKGRPVFIEGRLKLDQWEDKEGKKQSKLRVVVETFQFVDSKGDDGGGSPRPSGGGSAASRPAAAAPSGAPTIDENDIPF